MAEGRDGEKSAGAGSIYVVYAAGAQHSTGAQMTQQVLAIQRDREAAERVEADYNDRTNGGERVSERAFVQRYTLPYVAPAVKDLGGQG